jgi:hypothetical protein
LKKESWRITKEMMGKEKVKKNVVKGQGEK